MIKGGLGKVEAVRTAEPVFFLLVLFLVLPRMSGAQNKPLDLAGTPDVRPSALLSAASKPLKTYHDGSIRDIGAIGHRKVGCESGLGSRYSLEEQTEIGRSLSRKIETTFNLITDPVITEYVNRIGQELARNSDAHLPFNFAIIESDDLNAVSLPGGYVFVDSGLILAADSGAELAGVLAHEIGHVAACHAAQNMGRGESVNTGSMPLIIRLATRRLTANTVYLKPTRAFEAEADLLGVEYLYVSGYDPHALPSLFERIKTIKKPEPGGAVPFESYFRLTERIKETQKQIHTLLPLAAEYTVDTSEFRQVKQRLSKTANSNEQLKLR